MTRNALRFLRLAIRDYYTKPDQMAVKVYTSIELILKAKLAFEHWSLIIKGSPDAEKFKAGDFVTIGFHEAVKLIEGVQGYKIDSNYFTRFDDLRKVRNKIMHFSAPEWIPSDSDDWDYSNKKIRYVSLNAWAALHHLMLEDWQNDFRPYFYDLKQIDGLIDRTFRSHPNLVRK